MIWFLAFSSHKGGSEALGSSQKFLAIFSGEIAGLFSTGAMITAAAILLLLVFSGFFSGSETALTSASRAILRARADGGDEGASRALALTDDREKLIGAILLGNNFVNILATSLASALLTSALSEGGVFWATLIMTVLILIFAEVLPKTYALAHAERVALTIARPLAIIVALLSPLVFILRKFVGLIMRLVGEQGPVNLERAAHEEITGAIQLHHSEGGVEKQDRDRLLGALDLKNRDVEEIMKHRSQLEMIDKNSSPASILDQVLSSPYTRLPIYDEQPENIVGVLHAKDLLRAFNKLLRRRGNGQKIDIKELEKFDITSIAMEPYFIPETTSLDDQMHAFLARRSHFALVVDEYGSLQGLITLEDILEEIVGEISDEHDFESGEFERRADGYVELDGGMTIRDANRLFDWRLPDEEANTIAGLILHEAQMIPNTGQKFSFHGHHFEILERQRNRLTRIAVTNIPE